MFRASTRSSIALTRASGSPTRIGTARPDDLLRRQAARDAVPPLEGDGFEPSVPHKKQPFLAAPVRSRNSPSATKTGSFVPGTDGSNPSPSSEESAANPESHDQAVLISGGPQ